MLDTSTKSPKSTREALQSIPEELNVLCSGVGGYMGFVYETHHKANRADEESKALQDILQARCVHTKSGWSFQANAESARRRDEQSRRVVLTEDNILNSALAENSSSFSKTFIGPLPSSMDAARLQAIVGSHSATLRARDDGLKDLPRLELSFKSKAELLDQLKLSKSNGFKNFSLANTKEGEHTGDGACTKAKSKMLQWLQICLDEVPSCSLCVHYSLRHNIDKDGVNKTFERFTRFLSELNTLQKSDAQKVEVLLISGPGPKAGPKTPLDSVACLELLMQAGRGTQWADLGVAFNPHYQGAAQVKAERARLQRKLATYPAKTVWLQFGCDAQRLEESLQWLTGEVNLCLQVERLIDDFKKTTGKNPSSDVKAIQNLRDEVIRAKLHQRVVLPAGLKWERLGAPTSGRLFKSEAMQELLREKSEITKEELRKIKDLRGLTYDDCIRVDGVFFKPVPIQKSRIEIKNFFDGADFSGNISKDKLCPWVPFKPAFQRKEESDAREAGQNARTATGVTSRSRRDPRRLRVVGSLLLPTKQLLTHKSPRSWEGTFLSDAYLSCTEQAVAISKQILAIYARYGVELLVEAPGVRSLEDMELLRSLTADYYSTAFNDEDEVQEDERAGGGSRQKQTTSNLYRTL